MKQVYRYGLQLGNQAKEGIRVRITIEKENSDLLLKPMTVEEVEEYLRTVGKYLQSCAEFKTLTKLR